MDEDLRRIIEGEYLLEENRKIDKKARKLNRKLTDKSVDSKNTAAVGAATGAVLANMAMGLGIPSLVIGGAVGAATAAVTSKATLNLQKKRIFKYTKGDPLTKSTVSKLLNACQTKKDLMKFEVWLDSIDIAYKNIYEDNPKMSNKADKFRQWLDDEIYAKRLPKKREEIKKSKKKLKESYEYFNEYEYMTNEEFCEAMEEEAAKYDDSNSTSVTESISIYDMLSGDYDMVNEFFGFSNKQPKVDKDEQMFIDSLKNVVIIDKDEVSKYKKEINKLVKSLYSLLRKEIPKCDFVGDSEDNDVSYNINKKYGYTTYFCGEVIFELDSDNFDKYKAKSRTIKNVDYDDSYDYVDEIMDETEKRILKPLQQQLGLKYDVDFGPFAYSKFKDGKRYFTVDLGDEYMFDVTFEARFAVKE